MTTKEISVPFIGKLENCSWEDLVTALQQQGAWDRVESVNWPDNFPYRPDMKFRIARSETALVVYYSVKGADLRAVALKDGGKVWEDSCCEFFVEAADGRYWNFEMNCIGTLLAGCGTGRAGRVNLSPEETAKIRRFSTLPHESCMEIGGSYAWKAAVVIPFALLGYDPEHLPSSIRANFYKCGDCTAHPHFLSWNPIDTPSPDFHRPEFFGTLKLAE